MDKLRIGVLSTASIAPRLIGAARDAEGCEVVALASRSLAKAEEKAAAWGVPRAYGSYGELVAAEDVDLVYIPAINSEHYPWTKRALEAGKHVLCEKPMARREEQVRELFALARERGRFLMEAQKAVFLPAVRKARELLDAGAVGRVHMAEFASSVDPNYNPWQFDPEQFGGPVYGNSIYCVELCQYLFRSYFVQWSGLCTRGNTPVEDQMSVSLLTESGVLVTNRCSTRVNVVPEARIFGEKGYIELPEYWKARRMVLHRSGEAPEEFSWPCPHELVYEVRHAAACIREGRCTSPVMTEEMTVEALRVLHGVNSLWCPD